MVSLFKYILGVHPMIGRAMRRAFVLALVVPLAVAQQKHTDSTGSDVVLGRFANGASVKFVRSGTAEWGIEIAGGTGLEFFQPKPAQIEIYRGGDNTKALGAGYQSVQKQADGAVAKATVKSSGGAAFTVEDQWKIAGDVLTLSRKVTVAAAEENAGFYSAIKLVTAPQVTFADADYMAPGLLYGAPHTRGTAPGGSLSYNAKKFSIREDYLPAPLFGLSFRDGRWVSVLDMEPHGDTTKAETAAQAGAPIIDERIQFGALGARELPKGGIEFGFWLPGTTDEFSGGFGFGGRPAAPVTPIVRRRYHPVKTGFAQTYKIGFRFGQGESIRGMERDSWRWAWQTLSPKVTLIDVEVVRRTLIDHLADRVLVVDDRAGIPFVIDSVSGKPGSFRPTVMQFPRMPGRPGQDLDTEDLARWAKTIGVDMDPKAAELELWTKILMGFCGKNIEAASELLREADRDPSARGERMRKLGTMIIESLIRIVPMEPAPAGEGFDIRTGKASAVRGEPSFALRATAEDMRTMVDLIRRERAQGRQHPEWFAWAKAYTDWLLTVQREDGSFPESFAGSTGKPMDNFSGTSYAPVPLLVRVAEETGDNKYLDAASRAADFVWTNYGSKGFFIGATGNDIADKESGMLSMEAFLALYDHTEEAKWLERAKFAGDYAESYIWIWNVPMPVDMTDSELAWKHGVPTVGLQGIGSDVAGHSDEYLDWAAPSYAKLYKYTNDEHYLDVARVLLHDTKSMLALPGRTYDLLGPGWQQEHWRMGPGVRGIGAHRTWLPWISINHLHSITGLEEFDKNLYQQLARGN
jgi:Highly conserved protein containing a thioredoxin domain